MRQGLGENMYEFIISTQDQVTGYKITKTYGLAYGNIVRSTNIVKGFFGGLRTIFGGEIPQFTQVVQEAREHAVLKLIEHAKSMGANGLVGVRLSTSQVMQACSEIVAYGTAVYVEEE